MLSSSLQLLYGDCLLRGVKIVDESDGVLRAAGLVRLHREVVKVRLDLRVDDLVLATEPASGHLLDPHLACKEQLGRDVDVLVVVLFRIARPVRVLQSVHDPREVAGKVLPDVAEVALVEVGQPLAVVEARVGAAGVLVADEPLLGEGDEGAGGQDVGGVEAPAVVVPRVHVGDVGAGEGGGRGEELAGVVQGQVHVRQASRVDGNLQLKKKTKHY